MEGKKNNILTYIQIALIIAILFVGGRSFLLNRGVGGTPQNTMSQLGLEYYMENYGEDLGSDGVEAVVKNFGCHSEIHIFKNGELLMRLSYFNGKVYEI